MKPTISKDKLDCILDELNKSHGNSYDLIRAILELTPKHCQVAFAYHCALDVKHLLTDKRSLDALEAVKVYLEKGKAVPNAIIDAAYSAANAIYASSANTTAYAAANTAAYATNAAYAAYATSYVLYASTIAASCFPNREEKLTEHLNALKVLVLSYVDEQDKSDVLELCL